MVCRRRTGLLLVLAARCPSDSITQAPFKKKKCFSPRSELTALCRKHIPVPCTIDFPVKKRQANPSKLVASIHALAVSSPSHQPQQQEARLLPNISFIPNVVSYKARGGKKIKNHSSSCVTSTSLCSAFTTPRSFPPLLPAQESLFPPRPVII